VKVACDTLKTQHSIPYVPGQLHISPYTSYVEPDTEGCLYPWGGGVACWSDENKTHVVRKLYQLAFCSRS
jgi:hypothetical protein